MVCDQLDTALVWMILFVFVLIICLVGLLAVHWMFEWIQMHALFGTAEFDMHHLIMLWLLLRIVLINSVLGWCHC